MTVSGINSPAALQELQLLQQVQQQTAANTASSQNSTSGTEQNVPSGTNSPASTSTTDTGLTTLDPSMSPSAISALLLQLQSQQASLDTTLILGGSSTSSSGNTLLDYLNGTNDNGSDADTMLENVMNGLPPDGNATSTDPLQTYLDTLSDGTPGGTTGTTDGSSSAVDPGLQAFLSSITSSDSSATDAALQAYLNSVGAQTNSGFSDTAAPNADTQDSISALNGAAAAE